MEPRKILKEELEASLRKSRRMRSSSSPMENEKLKQGCLVFGHGDDRAAVCVSKCGLVLTCCHNLGTFVQEGMQQLLLFGNGDVCLTEVARADAPRDLALLRCLGIYDTARSTPQRSAWRRRPAYPFVECTSSSCHGAECALEKMRASSCDFGATVSVVGHRHQEAASASNNWDQGTNFEELDRQQGGDGDGDQCGSGFELCAHSGRYEADNLDDSSDVQQFIYSTATADAASPTASPRGRRGDEGGSQSRAKRARTGGDCSLGFSSGAAIFCGDRLIGLHSGSCASELSPTHDSSARTSSSTQTKHGSCSGIQYHHAIHARAMVQFLRSAAVSSLRDGNQRSVM